MSKQDPLNMTTEQLLELFPEFRPAWESTQHKNVRYALRKALIETYKETHP